MQIEFGLPNGAGGMAAHHSASRLKTQLTEWQKKYKINIVIESTRHDHRHWLTVDFASERDLSVFALTFENSSFMGWKRVLAE
jgi:phage FluMu gp28-like protein